MANNRYYLLCPCGATQYVGKSLGEGLYGGALDAIHDFIWEHLMANHAGNDLDSLGPEWVHTDPASGGHPLMTLITEYDDRAPGGYRPR